MKSDKKINRRGQVTIFIIIAVLIVASVVLFFVFRGKIQPSVSQQRFDPVYLTFSSCIETYARAGIDILETQGGYIYPPRFEPGSKYSPLSSQLDFLGNKVPYWYYVSGNNVQKEQIPTKAVMKQQLEQFIEERIVDCNFQEYYRQGLMIDLNRDTIQPSVIINDNNVEVNMNADLSVSDGAESAIKNNHKISVDSNLGKFYNSAIKIYNKEQSDLFLENYGIDSLRLYAPVDGVEVSCSPKVWKTTDVVNDIQSSIEANTQALKVKGNYYTLTKKENKYFEVNIPGVGESVRFLNSKSWPYKIEITPADGQLLIAHPVGNQPGVAAMGFCYAPYHFVYDLYYPVLVQISEGDELFQFPVTVVIQGNKERVPVEGSAQPDELPQLCEYMNQNVIVETFDTNSRSVDADISFECFGTRCDIGRTNNGVLNGKFPACANGFIKATREGFVDGKLMYSTNHEGRAEILMEKLYNLNVSLLKSGIQSNEQAVVNFVSDKNSVTILYPDQKSVALSEGQYNISVYSYGNTGITLPEETKQQCIDVSSGGIAGVFGATKKKCFDIISPAQTIDPALSGGGIQSYYVVESQLSGSHIIEINYPGFTRPESIDDIQKNYELLDNSNLDVIFK